MTFAMPDPPSSVPLLDYRYEVGELLGLGGFARVYAARDRLLDIPVAIKVMNLDLVSQKELVESFAREANLSARMLSPHIVKVLGLAVSAEGAPCIVYERLEGETLAARIERLGGLTLAATVDVVTQIARALSRVHSLGVIHRDIKPDNVFLVETDDGRPFVKLLDFGVAEPVDWTDAVETDMIAGTPEYMSPEVLQGTAKADARSDLYALGVLAFECLTGRCPYVGETIEDVCDLVTKNERAYLLDLRPDLPATIDDWMERALHPDPYWRFGTAKEMAESLAKAVDNAKSARKPAPMRKAA